MTIEQLSAEDEFCRAALELRYKLFFAEHGLPKSIVIDEFERKCLHFAIAQDNNSVTYGRLTELNRGQFKISQVTISASHQGKGYGKSLLRPTIEFPRNPGTISFELNSQATATALYQSLGFQ